MTVLYFICELFIGVISFPFTNYIGPYSDNFIAVYKILIKIQMCLYKTLDIKQIVLYEGDVMLLYKLIETLDIFGIFDEFRVVGVAPQNEF